MKRKITLLRAILTLLLFTATAHAQATPFGTDSSQLWLEMTTQAGHYCQTRVAYTPAATNGFDDGLDEILAYDGQAVLYTSADDKNLTVQARPIFRVDDVLPLHYKAGTSGLYTLSFANKTGIFTLGQPVYLRDKVVNTVTNISQQAYFFTTAAGTFEDRFEIVYITDAALGNDNPVAAAGNDIIMYKDGNSLNIDAGSMAMSDIKVFDMNGRLLRQSGSISNTKTVIDALYAERQVLLVQIVTSGGMVSRKIVF